MSFLVAASSFSFPSLYVVDDNGFLPFCIFIRAINSSAVSALVACWLWSIFEVDSRFAVSTLSSPLACAMRSSGVWTGSGWNVCSRGVTLPPLEEELKQSTWQIQKWKRTPNQNYFPANSEKLIQNFHRSILSGKSKLAPPIFSKWKFNFRGNIYPN